MFEPLGPQVAASTSCSSSSSGTGSGLSRRIARIVLMTAKSASASVVIAVDQDQVAGRRLAPDRLDRLVGVGAPPALGARAVGELDDHDAARRPAALELLDLRA